MLCNYEYDVNMNFDCKAMPTNDTDYRCNIKAVELV